MDHDLQQLCSRHGPICARNVGKGNTAVNPKEKWNRTFLRILSICEQYMGCEIKNLVNYNFKKGSQRF